MDMKMRRMRSQTSLPATNADPINRNPSSAKGFTSELEFQPRKKEAARVVHKRSNFYSSVFTVSTTAQIILGHNPNRSYLALQNRSLSDIYLSFGTPATIGNSILFPAGAVWTFENGIVPDNSVYALTAAASALMAINEGTYIQ